MRYAVTPQSSRPTRHNERALTELTITTHSVLHLIDESIRLSLPPSVPAATTSPSPCTSRANNSLPRLRKTRATLA